MGLKQLPCYCASIRQAARAVTSLYEEALSGSGLHATQYTALQVLESLPDLTTTEIADAIGIDQTTATRTLGLIRKAGLALDSFGDDRRERRWALTSAGYGMLRRLKPRWESAQAALEKRLGQADAVRLKQASYEAANKLSLG
jgi:DNA-binding MarR family transcriptional regulator